MNRTFRFKGDSLNRIRQYDGKADQPKEEAAPTAEAPETETAETAALPRPRIEMRTDVGKARANNQDALIDAWPVVGVADGMGGHLGGDVASHMAAELLPKLLADKAVQEDSLRTAFAAVNRRLFLRQEEDEKVRGMGTTMTVLWADEKQFLLGHVGDSRAYRLRGGALEQISRDHSLVAEMLREGLLTEEQAKVHPLHNMVTRAVGTEKLIETDVTALERQDGDVWLLCSDGLTNMVEEDRLREVLLTLPLKEAADTLLQEALDAGGRDNISLVLLLDREEAAQ